MTLADWRTHILLFTCVVFNMTIAFAEPPTQEIREGDVKKLERASNEIRAGFREISKADPNRLEALERALADIKKGLALYFHAPNLRDSDIRPKVLRMRKSLENLFATPPILILHHDVLRFAPEVHQDMASAYKALGKTIPAERHERLARASARRPAVVPGHQKGPSPSPPVAVPLLDAGSAVSPK